MVGKGREVQTLHPIWCFTRRIQGYPRKLPTLTHTNLSESVEYKFLAFCVAVATNDFPAILAGIALRSWRERTASARPEMCRLAWHGIDDVPANNASYGRGMLLSVDRRNYPGLFHCHGAIPVSVLCL